MSRVGARGGPRPAMTLEEAQDLFATWKQVEYGWIRTSIVLLAKEHGEYHADMLAHHEIESPNAIGAAVNALALGRLIEKLNRNGQVEHRRGRSQASHGRQSYVWRLTDRGRRLADWLEYRGSTVEHPTSGRARVEPNTADDAVMLF